MDFSKSNIASALLLVVVVFVTITSAQITFSRQWVRGKYPGDSEGGESPEFQRAAKAVYPSLREGSVKRAGPRFLKPDYIPILVNSHVLEEVLERMKEPPFGTPVLSLESSNVRK